ncbi:Ankyrin repeat-containing domain protein [Naviculisporaceae sp. PSN 640]
MSFGYSAGDFIAALEIIYRVTKRFAGAPKEYQRISDEVNILGLAIRQVSTVASPGTTPTPSSTSTQTQTGTAGSSNLNNASISTSTSHGPAMIVSAPGSTTSASHLVLQEIAKSCLDVLARLEKELDKYVDLGPSSQGSGTGNGVTNASVTSSFGTALKDRAKRGWHRFRFDPEEITKVRVQLTSHLQSFNSVQINHTSYTINSVSQGVGQLQLGQTQANQNLSSINQELNQLAIRQQGDSQLISFINRGVDELNEQKNEQQKTMSDIHGLLVNKDTSEERKKILDWISAEDFTATHQDFINRRQPGTGEWFLNSPEYQKWLGGTGQTLFCPGIPGAGKTMLTAIAIDHLTAKFGNAPDDIGIVYVYFSYQKEGSQGSADVFASLLRQFCAAKNVIPKKVKDLYKDCTETRSRRPTRSELVDGLDVVMRSFSRVFVLLDALDESRHGTMKSVVGELFALQEKNPMINLFATSRYIPEILAEFNNSELGRITTSIEVRASEIDVRRYLEGQMGELPGFARRDKKLQEEITTKIVNSVQGMFLLAQLHFRSLRGRATKKGVLQTLAKLESGSNAYEHAYEEAMARIKGQEQDQAELAIRALAWITCARRPLRTIELQHALAVEEGEDSVDEDNIPQVDDLVGWCAGLVTVDEQSGIIRLVHYTTQEYFQREGQKKWFPDAEVDMASTCLRYISFPFLESDMYLKNFWGELRYGGPRPFYFYAACNWGHHLRRDWLPCKELLNDFQRLESNVVTAGKVVPYLKGYDLNLPTQELGDRRKPGLAGLTGLHLMVYFGLHEALEFFLDQSEGPDAHVTDGGQTLLGWAAVYGQDRIARVLLSRGADLEKKDWLYGASPLQLASYHGHTNVFKLLLESGASAAAREITGLDSLMLAAHCGHESIVGTILEKHRDSVLSVNSKTGDTALIYASQGHHLEVVQLILQHLPDDPLAKTVQLNRVSRKRHTALSGAVWSMRNTDRRMETIQLLLDAGANPNLGYDNSFKRRPPLISPIHHHEPALLRLLLSRGANTETTSKCGWTPLIFAVYHIQTACADKIGVSELPQQAVEIFHILLEYGADINGLDTVGRRTPLIAAIMSPEPIAERLILKLVKLVVAAGANLETRDFTGRRALRYAIDRRYQTVVDFLVASGAKVGEGVILDVSQAKMEPERVDPVMVWYYSNGLKMRGG